MFLSPFEIDNKLQVSDIVSKDYRTADVFRRYGIGYCCGGKWPMDIACEMRGIDAGMLKQELETVTRTIQISTRLDFANWDIDFLLDYIINIHHRYLQVTLTETQQMLHEFTGEHIKKFPWLADLEIQFGLLINELLPSITQEEEVIFPYIRQLTHAHKYEEPYAALMIRTLRKPLQQTILKNYQTFTDIVLKIRQLTNTYIPPEKACISHRVMFAKLKELDNDLMQHLYLEQSVLFPRAMDIEKKLMDT